VEREGRALLGMGLAVGGLYLLLYGLLWLAHVGGLVRFPPLVRTPLDLLLSLPVVALFLTLALVHTALHLRGRLQALPVPLSRPLAASPLRQRLRRVPPLSPDASPEEALRRARAYQVPLLPCVEGGRLVGAVRLEDLLTAPDGRLPVGPAPTVGVEEPLARLLERLEEVPAVVVVEGEGPAYLGLLEARDLLFLLPR